MLLETKHQEEDVIGEYVVGIWLHLSRPLCVISETNEIESLELSGCEALEWITEAGRHRGLFFARSAVRPGRYAWESDR